MAHGELSLRGVNEQMLELEARLLLDVDTPEALRAIAEMLRRRATGRPATVASPRRDSVAHGDRLFISQVHALNALLLFAVRPFTRLVHAWSVPIAYVSRSPSCIGAGPSDAHGGDRRRPRGG